MNKVIDLFAGIGGLKNAFHDTYASLIEDSVLNNLIIKCYDELPAYSLNSSIHPSQEEYHCARHLADLDILEQFCTIFVRNHRNFKYCRGKSDTAAHVVQMLSEYGIFISVGKYNNWQRDKDYRLIDQESLSLLLEALQITPSEFKRLVYAHIMARREIKRLDKAFDTKFTVSPQQQLKDTRLSRIKFSRPPCAHIA